MPRLPTLICSRRRTTGRCQDQCRENGLDRWDVDPSGARLPGKAAGGCRLTRNVPRHFDRNADKERHRIENIFSKIKEFRAIETRYDKTASSFVAGIHLVAGVVAA